MSNELPPHVKATGLLKNVFDQIKKASVPPRFTQDFLVSKLGFAKSGSTMAIIPFLKKVGFIGSDGVPTELYLRFRDPDSKKAGLAIAEAMRIGYADLYERDEYFHDLGKNETKNFLITATGSDPKSSSIAALSGTLEILKSLAVFGQDIIEEVKVNPSNKQVELKDPVKSVNIKPGFNISYTINLNLPETSDPSVFDAIFKSLKEHILSNEE